MTPEEHKEKLLLAGNEVRIKNHVDDYDNFVDFLESIDKEDQEGKIVIDYAEPKHYELWQWANVLREEPEIKPIRTIEDAEQAGLIKKDGLDMSLAELELSVRATNCLEAEGIMTVRDLVSHNDEELLEIRNFGETTLKEVRQKLAEHGFKLREQRFHRSDAVPRSRIDVDLSLIGHTSNPHFEPLKNYAHMEALRDRTIKVNIPHLKSWE